MVAPVQTPRSQQPKADPNPLKAPAFYPAPDAFKHDCLILVGTVVGRIRRTWPQAAGGPPRFNVVLAIQTDQGIQRPERWMDSPEAPDIPERGQRIALPVVLTFFHGKAGTGARLTWGDSARGEEF